MTFDSLVVAALCGDISYLDQQETIIAMVEKIAELEDIITDLTYVQKWTFLGE